jgi:L,D-transpeptidase YbiS
VHEPLSRTEAEFNSSEQSSLPMTAAVSHFIAKADTDSHVVKTVLEDRTGMPTQINASN